MTKECGEKATQVPIKVVKPPFILIIDMTSEDEMLLQLVLLKTT